MSSTFLADGTVMHWHDSSDAHTDTYLVFYRSGTDYRMEGTDSMAGQNIRFVDVGDGQYVGQVTNGAEYYYILFQAQRSRYAMFQPSCSDLTSADRRYLGIGTNDDASTCYFYSYDQLIDGFNVVASYGEPPSGYYYLGRN